MIDINKTLGPKPKRRLKSSFKKCVNCSGQGIAYDPEDCCLIEGYKMADKTKCGWCSGIGLTHQEVLEHNWSKHKILIETRQKNWQTHKTNLISVNNKLTPSEICTLLDFKLIEK